MEWMNIAEILGLILGGGGIASFFTLRYERRRMKAESKSAENEATSKHSLLPYRSVRDT